jgi:serine/threonine-protein kinase
LVHRDIKPRNILLTRLGLEYDFTKILDFGLVKSPHVEGQEESMLTIDGVTTGTPAYLSPEIALGERDVDGRADLYSLGVVAYFLLTGRLVFEESSATAYAIAHVQKAPIPLSQRSEVPVSPGLEAIVMQLLEKDPANRFQSAQEVGRRLRALRDVRQWCPDSAARWWETNVPTLAATPQRETGTSPIAASPAEVRVHA